MESNDMDRDLARGKWQEFKAFLKRGWTQISDEAWESTEGDTEKITGLIQKHTKQERDEIRRSMKSVYNDFLADPNRVVPTEPEGRFDWESDGHHLMKKPIDDAIRGRESELKR